MYLFLSPNGGNKCLCIVGSIRPFSIGGASYGMAHYFEIQNKEKTSAFMTSFGFDMEITNEWMLPE